MVKPTDDYPLRKNGQLDRQFWVSRLCERHTGLDGPALTKACNFVAKISRNGEKLLRVGMEFGDLLGNLHQDTDSIVVAIIYRAQRGRHVKLSEVEHYFGANIARLVRQVNRMSTISTLNLTNPALLKNEERNQSENVGKLLVALTDDVRVAVLTLAERIIALRLAKNAARSRRLRMAQETLSFFAPLANRLGIWRLKWELEDLAFRYLQADEYKRVAKSLARRREHREIQITEHTSFLEQLLTSAGITAIVEGRAKHIYSIWKKMQRKGVEFSEIYDGLAVRVLVETVADCYAVLGVVHTNWSHIPKEFDDYIANAKSNGYQAIHTAVYDTEGSVLEVQIKTTEMHRESELGVCAHWLYKSQEPKTLQLEESIHSEKLDWLRQVLSGGSENENISIASELTSGLKEHRVYVYTPDGHVVDLAQDSTPVDFAYRIHTDIGHRCIGARVDGKEVALNSALLTGQRVEIIVASELEPNREWLEISSGFVTTTRARAKIQAWFRGRSASENIAAGEKLFMQGLERLNLRFNDSTGIAEIASKMGFKSIDAFYHAISLGSCQVLDILKNSGVEKLLQRQMDLLDVKEENLQQELLFVHCRNRPGLLQDITQILNDEHITMLSLNATTDSAKNTASISVTSLIHDFVLLAKVIAKIRSVPDVIDIERRTPV